jgi:hypothetical protein
MKRLILSIILSVVAVDSIAQSVWDYAGPVSGTNTYTLNVIAPTFPNSYTGTTLRLHFTNGNTTAATLNVSRNGTPLGAIAIRKWDGNSWEPLVSGDIPAGSDGILTYYAAGPYFKAVIYESIGGTTVPTLQQVITSSGALTTGNDIVAAGGEEQKIESTGPDTPSMIVLNGAAGTSQFAARNTASVAAGDGVDNSSLIVTPTGVNATGIFQVNNSAGLNDQVLTSNGAGSPATWQDAVGGTQDLQDVMDNGSTAATVTTPVTILSEGTIHLGSGPGFVDAASIDLDPAGDTDVSANDLINFSFNRLTINGDIGNAGEVLTSNGAGVAATWQAAAGGNVTTRNKLLAKYKVSDGNLLSADTSRMNILSGTGDVVITLDPTGLVDGTQYAFFRDQTDTAYFDYNGQIVKNAGGPGITFESFAYVYYSADTFRISTGGTSSGGGGSGTVEAVVAGNLIDVDATDPANPIAAVETGDKGDITIGSNSLQIDALAVTNAEINDVAYSKITSVPDAVADGATKGVAAFNSTYFDAALGIVNIDLTNGAASGSQGGYVTTGTQTFAGGKTYTGTVTLSGTANSALLFNGVLNPTTANNQSQFTIAGNYTTRPTTLDVFSELSIAPTGAAGAASQIHYGINVDMAGVSTTNSPQIYAINANGGGNFTMSSTATSPYALRVNRTTGSGDIATFQSNSTDLVLIRNASGSTAMSILPASGGLATALNLGGTVTAASGTANLQTISGTFLSTANGDFLRAIRSIGVYGANSRTNVIAAGFYHNPSFTISSGSWAFQGGILIDNTTSGVNLLNGFNLAAASVFSTVDVAGSFAANTASTAIDITLSAIHHTIRVDDSGAARTITLPTAASSTRRIYVIKKMSASNTTTVDADGAETIDGATTFVLSAQYASVMIQSNGTSWDILSQ